MMRVSRGDIVLLSYTFSDLKGSKVRPALVVSNNGFNKKSDDCVLVPMTSVIRDESYSLIVENRFLSFGRLIRKSRIRFDKVFCVDKNLIIKKIGQVKGGFFRKVKKEILMIF